MLDILSQEEINTLLEVVEEGDLKIYNKNEDEEFLISTYLDDFKNTIEGLMGIEPQINEIVFIDSNCYKQSLIINNNLITFYFSVELMNILGDMMLGGDGNLSENELTIVDEESFECSKEIINNILNSFKTNLQSYSINVQETDLSILKISLNKNGKIYNVNPNENVSYPFAIVIDKIKDNTKSTKKDFNLIDFLSQFEIQGTLNNSYIKIPIETKIETKNKKG